jgi:outer membrane protein assembly factor BamB
VLVDGKTVLCVPGGPKGRVVALDKATGALLWANTEIDEQAAYCSPIIVEHKGVRQFITLMHKSAIGVDVKTGKLLWRHEHPTQYGQNVTRPLYNDGFVLVSGGHNSGSRMLQINPANDGVREVWYTKEMDNCHGGITLLDGYLYGSGCRLFHKGLHCLEFSTGKKASTAVEVGKVSTTFAEGLLYCVDQERKVFLVRPSPQGSKIISRFELPNVSRDLVLCHPVVCGGRLYLRHDANLYCYDVKAK